MGSIFSWTLIRILLMLSGSLAQISISRKAIESYFSLPFSLVITLRTYVLKLTHSVCLVAERPLTGIWLTASCGTGTLPGDIAREEAFPPTPAGGQHSRESIVPGYGTPPLMLSRTDILPSLESGSDHHSIMQLLQDTDQGKIMQCGSTKWRKVGILWASIVWGS